MKNYLRKEFEANTSYLLLTKQQKLENGDTIMTLASSYERYFVVADKCGGIRKAERSKF